MTAAVGAIPLPVNRLHLELTNRCNFSCEFCPDAKMSRKRGLMPLETAKAAIDQVAATGAVKTVLFHVMGEPTLHPQLVDIVAHAASRNVAACLTTNGSRLDERLADELVRAGVGRIIISLQTPNERTFALRGAQGVAFDDYAERIVTTAKKFLTEEGPSQLTISFLSSPLRRLIIPIFPEVSIADTTADLKRHLKAWAGRLLNNSPLEARYGDVLKQMQKIRSFRENTLRLGSRVTLHTRVMGDWAVHFDRRNVDASFGYCPGLRENFGILWNGDYTFCCTDFDGRTSTHNFSETPIADYLATGAVQEAVKGFRRLRVAHPHCRQCLGDRSRLNALVKQVGSIAYFKWLRRKNSI